MSLKNNSAEEDHVLNFTQLLFNTSKLMTSQNTVLSNFMDTLKW